MSDTYAATDDRFDAIRLLRALSARVEQAPAVEAGARDERVSMIQTLMLDWINAKPGDDAKAVWNRIEEKLAALTRASEAAQKPTVEQVIDLLRQAVREIPASIATELWQVTPIQIMWVIGMLRKAQPISASEAAAGEPCGACNGSGWVTRDPDIGTDQECFVCDGRGRVNEAAPQPASAQAKGE